jgi:hypothetical protein
MELDAMTLLLISFLGLIFISLRQFVLSNNKRHLFINLILIVLCIFIVYKNFFFIETPVAKGPDNSDIYLIILICYIVMLLGMLCHFLFFHYVLSREKRGKFDWGRFLAPIFISPIIFIPIATTLQNSKVDFANPSTVNLMIFLIAFQNGFFWKELFDNRINKDKS